MIKPNSIAKEGYLERTDTQKVLPENEECLECGIDLSRDGKAHDFICCHPLMPDIIATSREGKLVGKVKSLLSSSSAESRNSILQPVRLQSASSAGSGTDSKNPESQKQTLAPEPKKPVTKTKPKQVRIYILCKLASKEKVKAICCNF